MGKPCFIFNSRWDAEVYRYLKENCPDEVNEIETTVKADRSRDPNPIIVFEACEMMSNRLRALFTERAPIAADYGNLIEDVYGKLLAHAINSIDFTSVAEAFLEDVELPEPPPLPEIE